jgi:ribulose-phosphate 3-epimerase
MDGHYVPNITIGPVVVEWIRRVTDLPLDVHLMISDPDKYAPEFIKAGADWISVHPETCKDLKTSLRRIRELGARPSIAINPDIELDQVEACLDEIDMVLMMTVFPGFGGQSFIEDVLPKIERARDLVSRRGVPVLIEADGGIKADNISRVLRAGVEVIVSGSGIFKTIDYTGTIRKMKEAAQEL